MRTVIAGSRNITDPGLLAQALTDAQARGLVISEVVSGTARGVDRLGEDWARAHNVPVKQFPPDWDRYGKRAGLLRNEEMACYADAVLLLWDGVSRGTAHMANVAATRGILHRYLYMVHGDQVIRWS